MPDSVTSYTLESMQLTCLPFSTSTMNETKTHIATNANDEGNLWCHLDGCRGIYLYTLQSQHLGAVEDRSQSFQLYCQLISIWRDWKPQPTVWQLLDYFTASALVITTAKLDKGTPLLFTSIHKECSLRMVGTPEAGTKRWCPHAPPHVLELISSEVVPH